MKGWKASSHPLWAARRLNAIGRNNGLGTRKRISDGLFSNGDLGGGPVGAQGRGLGTGDFILVEWWGFCLRMVFGNTKWCMFVLYSSFWTGSGLLNIMRGRACFSHYRARDWYAFIVWHWQLCSNVYVDTPEMPRQKMLLVVALLLIQKVLCLVIPKSS